MIASEREVLTAVLEADISEVGEHLSAVEVGLSNEHDSSARVTEEREGHDVSAGARVMFFHFSMNTCSVSLVFVIL